MTYYEYIKQQQIKSRIPKATKVNLWTRQRIPNANKGVIL